MNHQQYKNICLAIKNDVDFLEFQTLCLPYNYSSEYIESIWMHYMNKPLEFVLYHDFGKEIFDYLNSKENLIKQVYQP